MISACRRWRHTRRTDADRRVLRALRDGGQHFGYPLRLMTGIRSGRLYPALRRLENAGLVSAGWEDKPVHPRRWYQLTADGLREITPQVIP